MMAPSKIARVMYTISHSVDTATRTLPPEEVEATS